MAEDTPLNIIDEAKKIRDEIKAENDRRDKILEEEQKLRAEQMLAGTSGAIVPKAVVSEEEIKKQSAIDMFKGTGIDEAIKKHG